MAESFFKQLRDDPATKALLASVGDYAGAKAGQVAGRVAGKVAGENSGAAGAVAGAAEAVADDKAEGKKGGPLSAITGAIKGFFGKGGGSKRPTNIYEQLLIGVPVEVAFREWKKYSEFPKFMKGPESVTEEKADDSTDEAEPESSVGTKTKWTAKIFLNRRSWTATVEEDIENYKIRWSTEAAKGTLDGTVTFHPLGDNLTAMVYVLEYRPKGFFEWWGNRNRVVGRRARLDVKHFGRYVTMQPTEESESEVEEDQGQDQAQESPESNKQAESAEQPAEESPPDSKEEA
jgi:uncharacterized membrane protein